MTDKEKTTQDTTFDMSSCMEKMKDMMGQGIEECYCADMMSQFTEKDATPDIQRMMSQMESCCGIRKEEKSASL